MPTVYQNARYGSGRWTAGTERLADATQELRNRLSENCTGPYQLKLPTDAEYSFGRNLRDHMARVREILAAAPEGTKLISRGKRDEDPKFSIRKTFKSAGPTIVKAALSQLGVPYIWADADPAGGGSSGFDCSGLTMWAYAQVDVILPHQADAQMRDPQVTLFEENSRLKKGDLVFYNTGRLSSGQADHVGIYAGDGMVVDASSSLDAVVRRSYTSNPVLRFGFIHDVTGKHPA